jgi:lambda family phage portal protein
MSIFDRFKKNKPRRRLPVPNMRGYDAGMVSRLTADFNFIDQTPNQNIHVGLKTMRARSRDLFRNNDYARKYGKLLTSNVVGPKGIQLQMRVRNDVGSGYDTLANDRIEAAWREWGRECTMCGRYSWLNAQKAAIRSVAVDGEVFIQLVEGRAAGPYGFKIQFIEPDKLDHNLNETYGGRNIRLGVEVDEWSKPIAYWFLNEHPAEHGHMKSGRKYNRVPADQIIHAFMPEEVGAWRGVPWIHSGTQRLKMLGGYEEAELVAARSAASKMGFIYSQDGDGYDPDDTDAAGNLIQEIEPGVIEQLPEGSKFESFDPQHPMSQFGDFLKSMLRGVSAGLGTAYNYLAGDLEGVNFSSLRQGNLMEQDEWRTVQQWMIHAICVPVFERWLISALGSPALNLPASRFNKFNAATWQPRGWAWVDPVKEANANMAELGMGVTSRTIIAAAAGRDLEDVFKDLKAEQELAAAMGVTLSDPAAQQQDEQTEGADDV